jgi:5-methylcytosine-specific restriction endonuclease McrA
MERMLGAEFSQVRVHVGQQAAAIGALAFTSGNDIFFAQGRYQPETSEGRRLLGHELAHVLQQRQGRVRNPLGSGLAVVRDAILEAEADRAAQRAAQALMHGVCNTGGCGCSGAPAQTAQAMSVAQAAKLGHTGVRYSGRNPVRKATYKSRGIEKIRSERVRKRVLRDIGGKGRKKRKPNCGYGATPRAANWRRRLWDGSSRPGWTPANLLAFGAGGACADPNGDPLCTGVSAHIDHIIPFREHISGNAPTQIFCDEICHFMGVSYANAHTWYNDNTNLQRLCQHCNSVKAAADRIRPQNVDDPPVPVGNCGTGDCGTCNADVCL